MKVELTKILSAVAMVAATFPALAADVGVSVQISQPGVYGRIDIGSFPQPTVVMPQPVIIYGPAVNAPRPQPVYLWVPPGHRSNWKAHCGAYNACGVPVYFVEDQWYDQNVMKGKGKGKDKGQGQGNGKGHGKGD